MCLSDRHYKSSHSFNWILIESDLTWSQLFAKVYLSRQRLKNDDKVTWSCKMAEIWQTSWNCTGIIVIKEFSPVQGRLFMLNTMCLTSLHNIQQDSSNLIPVLSSLLMPMIFFLLLKQNVRNSDTRYFRASMIYVSTNPMVIHELMRIRHTASKTDRVFECFKVTVFEFRCFPTEYMYKCLKTNNTQPYSSPWALFVCLFDLILYVPVNYFSVMSGRVFLGWTSTKQGLMCLAQGHNTVTPVRLEPATSRSWVKHFTNELLHSP